MQLELKSALQTTAAGWNSMNHGLRLELSRLTGIHKWWLPMSKQRIRVSSTLSLCRKQDHVALIVHAISATPVGSSKAVVRRIACRASPFSYDAVDPDNSGASYHSQFSSIDQVQKLQATRTGKQPVLIASEGMSTSACFGAGLGPSFQAAARAGATGIDENSSAASWSLGRFLQAVSPI